MTWAWNKDYKDLGQVEEHYPAYLAVCQELRAAGQYPHDASFKGRVPGIAGPREDTAIYLLQVLRGVRDTQDAVTTRLAAGWRSISHAEVGEAPARFSGIAEYAIYHAGSHATGLTAGGSGWREWANARLMRSRSSVLVLPARYRVSGHVVSGKLIVRDGAAMTRKRAR